VKNNLAAKPVKQKQFGGDYTAKPMKQQSDEGRILSGGMADMADSILSIGLGMCIDVIAASTAASRLK
jgi:hypothetical protein